jgi:hypothetical protein
MTGTPQFDPPMMQPFTVERAAKLAGAPLAPVMVSFAMSASPVNSPPAGLA